MDNHHLLCIIASIGSVVVNINGRIIYLAIGLNLKGYYL